VRNGVTPQNKIWDASFVSAPSREALPAGTVTRDCQRGKSSKQANDPKTANQRKNEQKGMVPRGTFRELKARTRNDVDEDEPASAGVKRGGKPLGQRPGKEGELEGRRKN